MTNRDPLREPKTGDVIRFALRFYNCEKGDPNWGRFIDNNERDWTVTRTTARKVFWSVHFKDERATHGVYKLKMWRQQCMNGTVINAAE